MATATEMVTAIDAAILSILSDGQDLMLNGRRYTKANLADLQNMRTYYSEQAKIESSGGVFDRMRVGSPYRA